MSCSHKLLQFPFLLALHFTKFKCRLTEIFLTPFVFIEIITNITIHFRHGCLKAEGWLIYILRACFYLNALCKSMWASHYQTPVLQFTAIFQSIGDHSLREFKILQLEMYLLLPAITWLILEL